MNYGNNIEPDFLPNFNLQHVNHLMHFYHAQKMYLGYFGKVPSNYTFSNSDIERFHQKFPEKFETNILGKHFRRYIEKEEHKAEIIYILKHEIILEQEPDEVHVYFHDEKSTLLHQLLEFVKGFKLEKPDKAHINLIITQPHGLDNKKIDFTKPDLDLSMSYNDDFPKFMIKCLKSYSKTIKADFICSTENLELEKARISGTCAE